MKVPQKMGPKSLVRSVSVTAEILLQKIGSQKFGQNRVNNSCDYADMDKCCLNKCHHNSPRNLALKFGQNQVTNSWDIPDMDKCRQQKCCLLG